ncbi:MAG: hypothetical protein AVDCRST_MAG23-2586, partial [uncultured Sphingosinicella sp.]
DEIRFFRRPSARRRARFGATGNSAGTRRRGRDPAGSHGLGTMRPDSRPGSAGDSDAGSRCGERDGRLCDPEASARARCGSDDRQPRRSRRQEGRRTRAAAQQARRGAVADRRWHPHDARECRRSRRDACPASEI